MERPSVIKNYNPYRFLVIFYIVGLAGHLIPFTRSFMLIITPLALLISVITVLIPFIQHKQWKIFIFILLCGIAGFTAEIAGVNTGLLFGGYSYGSTLGPGISGVPFAMILNWIIITAGSISFSEVIFKKNILIVLSAAVFSALLDYIMEPVAILFDYWSWQGNVIPLTNYLTWGILMFVFAVVFRILKFTVQRKLPAFLFAIHLIYFLILRTALYLDIL